MKRQKKIILVTKNHKKQQEKQPNKEKNKGRKNKQTKIHNEVIVNQNANELQNNGKSTEGQKGDNWGEERETGT